MEIAVSVKEITKKYKLYEDNWGPLKEIFFNKKLHNEFFALKNISLDFPKGESIGVLGKNGSGKSTLLKIITGIAEPTTGSVDVNGTIVFLDVSSGIDSELSGYDNIFMKGILLGYTKEEMMEKVDDIIEFSELEEFIYQPVKNYSSGMRAKLGFAISVNVDPDILIVDEALAVGDSLFRAKCMNKMNEFKEQGKTIIFVSHDKNAVESFCSKAAWIHQGELITYGDSKVVGSIYNEFMSGKKKLSAIRSEIHFNHAIEQVSYNIEKTGFSIGIDGYFYGQKNIDFNNQIDLVLRDMRTGEAISKPLEIKSYSEKAMGNAGFSIQFNEKEFPHFFKPGKISFRVRYKNEEKKLIEFPLWARKVNIIEPERKTGNFLYKLTINNNNLELTIDNRDKVEQQVNRIWFKENNVNIEGVAFVKGYETKSNNDVKMNLQLTNLKDLEKYEFPVIINETDEITENPNYNPQGNVYNFSQYNVEIDLSNLKNGKYECKLIYQMNESPFYEFINLVWATRNDRYPTKPHIFNNQVIEINTETKYLQIEKKATN
ncbi:ABC transporter ATP-binding protein [Sporosarcina sp. Marseille-Q4063]|uniref:ABC transporter ATP-binding protein n=1 Tax=Sporosarcina sp. Marseille-Q4063 TaxID=2810514 RepID=UPI001BAF6FEC|nr:ABC transporter ATP-binding protein [Sporosarcina sp. Marseille-Q4063]QUW21217.1 ABC transporter ATP-binding protein [Sporosarcina sp. Marseille-Q4063]